VRALLGLETKVVVLEPGATVGVDRGLDLSRGFTVTDSGITVVGKNASPLYAQLAKATGDAPQWNFHKYLINRDASQVVAYSSFTKPDDTDLLKKIDEFLK